MNSKYEDLVLIQDLCAIINDLACAGPRGDNGQGDAIRNSLYKTMKGHDSFSKSGIEWVISYKERMERGN